MRHLKPVCVTEMDIISGSVTTKKRVASFLAWLCPFYTAPSCVSALYLEHWGEMVENHLLLAISFQ